MLRPSAFKPRGANAIDLRHLNSLSAVIRRIVCAAASLVVTVLAPGHALAVETNVQADAQHDRGSPTGANHGYNVGTRLGIAAFLNSRSLALEHTVKQSAALSISRTVIPDLELGGALAGVATTDSNYGVWSVGALGRYQVYRNPALQLALGLYLGVGHNAPILHDDLKADLSVVPYAALQFDSLWKIGNDWWLGPALSFEQLSVLHLAAQLRFGS
jgi:hypothetical protein